MHPEAMAAVADLVGQVSVKPNARALDLGGQYINGTARTLVPAVSWDVLDIDPGEGVTHVGDATSWRSPTRYDVVLCTEVLEHVQDWRGVLATAAAALAPAGVLLLTCASTGRGPHGATGANRPAAGEWYANVEPDDLRAALTSLFAEQRVVYRYPPGDAYAWATGPR